MAWSPWTLKEMKDGASVSVSSSGLVSGAEGGNASGDASEGVAAYTPQFHHGQISSWLVNGEVVSPQHMHEGVRGRWRETLARCVSLVILGGLGVGGEMVGKGKVDVERAGIVMVRY